MAPSRIDSFLQAVEGKPLPDLQAIVEECVAPQLIYAKDTQASVGRTALIVQRYCQTADPAKLLIERFCNKESADGPLRRSSSFELHNHKVYLPDYEEVVYEINSWMRCKSAKQENGEPVLIVEQDLNTLVTENEQGKFTLTDLGRFFRMASTDTKLCLNFISLDS